MIAVVVLIALFVAATQVYTNVLWFEQLGYLKVFVTQNLAAIGLFVVSALVVAGLMFLSLWLAYRHRPGAVRSRTPCASTSRPWTRCARS